MRPPLWQAVAGTVACALEVVGLWSDRVPTGSQIAKQHPWVAGLIVGGLAVHFRPDQDRVR